MVDVTPGNEGANKGFWRVQLRDRFSKFVEMGGEIMFDIQLPGVDGVVQAFGYFIGNAEPGIARIEVRDNSRIPKGIYLVKHSDITAILATLPDEYVEKKLAEANEGSAPAETPLKKSMAGSEVLKERLRSVARALKADGRFPIPRMTPTSTIGKTSDTAKGAKLDYKKVFDAEPALQEKYKTFENMWEAVYNYGVDNRTQSPNELANIPEDMKELNRAYAKHVLGLDPEGLITFYRNAINSKYTEEESAVGYVSIDRDMAYDYNARFEQREANGRYEIDVKPAEAFGMLGYSKVEDEYGVTIGREVTAIPDRVRRIGDLASPEIQAPWLKELADKYRIAYGASPFRGFNMLSEFDFHPVDPLGQNVDEFFGTYGLSSADIKAKFDQLFGEGAYDRYKASGNTVNFQRIRDLFVKLPDGRIGLDGAKLEDMGRLVKPEEMVNDLLDNTLKMLSVFQELTGQPFMTHKTRDYTPPLQEKEEAEKPAQEVPQAVESEISIQIGDMSEASIEPGYANWMASALEFLEAAGEEEEEWQREEEEEAGNSGTNTRGNLLQSMFLEAAAYNGKPRLVSQEEFDAINSETVYRGVSDKIFVDDYLNSSIQYAGEGSFGNGTYTTNRRETTEFYAGDKSDSRGTLAEKTMEIKLAPDANILSFDEVTEMREWATGQGNEFMGRSEQLGANPAQMQAIDWHLLNASDWTNLAIMLGYDAVRFKVPMTENEESYTIILNRGKVIVNAKS